MSYAKDHEDEWLLGQFPADFKGYAVELGALDGTFISCTRLLEERGWAVLCIEPNPRHQEALRRDRKLVMTCACGALPQHTLPMWENPSVQGCTQTTYEGIPAFPNAPQGWTPFWATVLTLDQCLMCANFPRLDVLVLDVDGAETQIIEGFDIDRWKPKAVIIEGAAHERLEPFLSRGYHQVGVRQDDNRLLVREGS